MVDYRNPGLDTQALILAKYLPTGRLWNGKFTRDRVLGRLVFALAGEVSRLFDAVEKFVTTELDPAKTNDLILEWEKSVGIPDKCFGRPDGLDERRTRIAQKLANFSDVITIDDFDEFMLSFDQSVGFERGSEASADKLGFGAGPYSTQELKEIRHTLAVRVEGDAEVFPLDFPITFTGSNSSILECLIRRIAPAHVELQFFFNEDLNLPFVIPDTVATMATAGRSQTANAFTLVDQPQLAMPEAFRPAATAQAITITEDLIEPSDLAGHELDLDAKTPSISSWADQSVAGNDVAQATVIRQPSISTVNSNVSLLFDGDAVTADSDLMRNSSASITSPPATIALCLTPTSTAAGVVDILKFRAGFNEIFTFQRDGTDLLVIEGQGGGATTMTIAGMFAAGDTRWVIARFRNSGDGVSDVLTDEGDTASASVSAAISTAIDDINIAANANGADAFAGHIHQALYWNDFVSDNERTDIGDYLNSEWTTS